MRLLRTIAFVLALPLLLSGRALAAAGDETLTVILVRHGEKAVVAPDNADPDLSEAGQLRARELARMFAETGVTALFASHFKRTQQTVAPLAERLQLKPEVFSARDTAALVQALKARRGQTVLVAGHNNTVPALIEALGGPKLEVIPEREYDRLFILQLAPDGRVQLLRLRYGAATP
ncbi:MAG: histidine phosphatase family protein [Verrucomicrobia bacterium]|nr:histidine phosphatase family protein [Verrucomicrobiota bacterium]